MKLSSVGTGSLVKKTIIKKPEFGTTTKEMFFSPPSLANFWPTSGGVIAHHSLIAWIMLKEQPLGSTKRKKELAVIIPYSVILPSQDNSLISFITLGVSLILMARLNL